ncbi:MAG: patatin-like phospholipase family protein [Actinomycetota bacterium]
MSVGVVLGAGGPLGWAYHLGVIEGVREAIGREPANADRVIGTSAGAAIAATLLTGVPTEEELELITAPPSAEDQERMRSAGSKALRNPVRALRPLAPGLVRQIGRVGVTTALSGLLPAGLFPTVFLRRFGADEIWPEPLWIPSVRIDDGEVVVFGRDDVPATLGDAIEATSAIPGVFAPKLIDGARYVDGGVVSSTHADALLPEQHDIALVAAPMTRPGGGPLRARARRRLDDEVAALRAAGTSTLVLTPDEDTLAAAEGFPRQRPEAGADIVAAARRQTVTAFRNHGPPGHRH